MHITVKDIVIYALLGLGAAVLVNHYAELNIPVLNRIEGAIVSSSSDVSFDDGGYVSQSGDTSSDCYDKSKVSGDRRASLRQQIEQARNNQDWDRQRELEDELRALTESERGDCR